jgi:hypothetical protein
MVLGIFGLFRFLSEASKFAGQEFEADAGPDAMFHKRVVQVSTIGGVIGAVLGVAGLIVVCVSGTPKEERRGVEVLLFPFVFAAIGIVSGMSLTCLFAPDNFFQSPSGDRLLKFIGTDKVIVARIACGAVVFLVLAFLSLLVLIVVLMIIRGR